MTFKIKRLLASSARADLSDSLRTKKALRRLGYYDTPDYGLTPYPDRPLFDGLSSLQNDIGLMRTGEMRPGDDTERSINLALKSLDSSGAESSTYIWRTRGDSKVRSEHAARDGQVFSWDDPPEGGHPGEAPNCRCTAEVVEDNKSECVRLKAQLEVDGNNLEAARKRYDEANEEVEIIAERVRETEEKISELWRDFRELPTPRPSGKIPGKVSIAAKKAHIFGQITELRYKHNLLSTEHAAAVRERERRLSDFQEWQSVRARTQQKYDDLGCGSH